MVCCTGDIITVWRTSDWSEIIQFKGHEDRVESVQLRLTGRNTPSNGIVVSASRDRTVKYWDMQRYAMHNIGAHTLIVVSTITIKRLLGS